ncbi:hypothetical protein CHELA1G11_14134 [Hyphomicrobiales bacterium]|nr:hypothetical protein CHELA1G2_10180 [Hyphomicrobiales bacterium]CAH1676466.1 hypothetical protein CHELA1G11_14134 [Hyphomicrobiales bacterium]
MVPPIAGLWRTGNHRRSRMWRWGMGERCLTLCRYPCNLSTRPPFLNVVKEILVKPQLPAFAGLVADPDMALGLSPWVSSSSVSVVQFPPMCRASQTCMTQPGGRPTVASSQVLRWNA